jgi:hypothetical protein
MDKAWDPTLDHLSKRFAQCKAYSDNRAVNSGFKNASAICDIPTVCTIATTTSSGDFTSCDLYIKSLEESLALAHNYVIKAPTRAPAPTPVVDPMATQRLDMDAQCKQFELLLKQNLDLVTALAKASASTNPGSSATPKPRRTGCKHSWADLKECPNCKICAPTSWLIISPWQRMRTNAPQTISYPRQPDRSQGPTLILI